MLLSQDQYQDADIGGSVIYHKLFGIQRTCNEKKEGKGGYQMPPKSEKEEMLNALVRPLCSYLCTFFANLLFVLGIPACGLLIHIFHEPNNFMLAWQSKRIFSAMLDDIIFDVALQAHHEVLRGKAVCQICNTRWVDTTPPFLNIRIDIYQYSCGSGMYQFKLRKDFVSLMHHHSSPHSGIIITNVRRSIRCRNRCRSKFPSKHTIISCIRNW